MGTLDRLLVGACPTLLVVGVMSCVPVVHTSAVPIGGQRFAATDRVQIAATVVPAGATELGIVEAHSSRDVFIESLIPEFAAAVGRMGGNFAKVDLISAKYEMQTLMMPCGQPSQMCAHPVEVPTVQIQGRAFLLAGGQP